MRWEIFALAAACACGPSSHELHVECGPATVPLSLSHFSEAGLLELASGRETHVCADAFSVSLYYAGVSIDTELARVTALLARVGFREIPPAQAVGTMAISSTSGDPNLVPVGIFASGRFEVGVHAHRYPNNTGAPFEISLSLYTGR